MTTFRSAHVGMLLGATVGTLYLTGKHLFRNKEVESRFWLKCKMLHLADEPQVHQNILSCDCQHGEHAA